MPRYITSSTCTNVVLKYNTCSAPPPCPDGSTCTNVVLKFERIIVKTEKVEAPHVQMLYWN